MELQQTHHVELLKFNKQKEASDIPSKSEYWRFQFLPSVLFFQAKFHA